MRDFYTINIYGPSPKQLKIIIDAFSDFDSKSIGIKKNNEFFLLDEFILDYDENIFYIFSVFNTDLEQLKIIIESFKKYNPDFINVEKNGEYFSLKDFCEMEKINF